jgi:hypothetical protein
LRFKLPLLAFKFGFKQSRVFNLEVIVLAGGNGFFWRV